MISALVSLGVNPAEISFIWFSVIAATIGGLAHTLNTILDFSKRPETAYRTKSVSHFLENVAWVIGKSVLAVITGLVLGMYLAPLAKSGNDVLRLLALVAVAGYSAPKLWVQQGKTIEELVVRSVKRTLGQPSEDTGK